MSHLSISLLGGFEVLLDGRPLTAFGTDKVRGLLAYLAIGAGRSHRRTALAGLFWPDLPDERAAQNLRQSLLLLRRALRETDPPGEAAHQPFLLLGRQEIQFNPLANYSLDVASFLELVRAARQHQHVDPLGCSTCMGWLKQAAGLYRGDLLAGLALRDSTPFEEWQLVQQESLHGRALEVLAHLTDYYERRGEPAQVLEYARRLLALEPWHERAQMQVMAALAQSGQEAAALEQYANYSRILTQEFGMAPSEEASALYRQIRLRHAGGHSEAHLSSPGTGAPAAALVDERRQVTALVCRRGWGGNVDPEELHEQMARCNEQCAPILERFGGRRQPRQGAECLTYFGYPVAQEDAARRAVSAALAVVEAARGSEPVRVGIHTGTMISGVDGPLGSVPDLARDCVRLAAGGTVIISAQTERIVRGWFESQPAGTPRSAELGLLHVVRCERPVTGRLDWLAASRRLTPLAGREDELRQLSAHLEAAQQGQGHLITLCGDPGIGKSRLVWELKQRAAGKVRWIESRCSPYFQNTTMYPIVAHLEQLLGFGPADEVGVKRDKLAAVLTRDGLTQPAALWLISLMLGLPTETPRPDTITQEQRERMRELCLALVGRESARQPLALVIEDLHWADPTSLAWIGRSLDDLLGLGCVVLFTWRPTFAAPWLPRRQACSLELAPLAPSETAKMVTEIAGRHQLSDEVRRLIIRQTDGVPLYVEQLTQTLVESEASEAADPAAPTVPATLLDSLTAHIDRMGPARETAQWAAVLGRGFSHAILAASSPFDEQRLMTDLEALIGAGLLIVQPVVGQPGYMFRHALIQDAAYGMLIKRARQACHRRVAETIVSRFPHIAQGQPEVLAHHYGEAGLHAEAADAWMQAGERAIAQGATDEARAFLERALAEVPSGDHERRWRALLGRETVLSLREERAAQCAAIDELIALAATLGNDVRLVQAHQRQIAYAARVADYPLGLAAAEAACQAAARTRDPALELDALVNKVQALCNLSEVQAASPIVESVLARLPEVTDEAAKAYALALLAMYYSHLGDISRALKLLLEGVRMTRHTGQRLETSRLLANIGLHYSQLGKYAEARAAHEEGLALAEGIGDRNTQTMQRWNLCYVLWSLGDAAGARAYGESALLELRTRGQNSRAVATCLGHLGLIAEDTGDLATAAACLSEARRLYIETAARGPQMEVQAVEARCLLRLGQAEEAAHLAEEVWAHLLAHGLVMFDYPSRVFACIADVMAANETPLITVREVLEAGYRELMRSAEMIEDPDWRRSFLENEVSNRTLLARWEAINELSASLVGGSEVLP